MQISFRAAARGLGLYIWWVWAYLFGVNSTFPVLSVSRTFDYEKRLDTRIRRQ